MTDVPKHAMTADEFLAWTESRPPEAGKFELWDGAVVVRHGPGLEERSEHWEAKFAIARALHDAVHSAALPCYVAADGPLVRLSPARMVKPDVLVYGAPKVPRGVQEVPNPIVVVEVLSPSTRQRDHGVKQQGYFTLPSLRHYLIVDPDRACLIHHRRSTGGAPDTRIVTASRLRLDPPGLDVDLTEVLVLA